VRAESQSISASGTITASFTVDGVARTVSKTIWAGGGDFLLHVSRSDGVPVSTGQFGDLEACPYTDYEFYVENQVSGCYTIDHFWNVPSTWTINAQQGGFISINTNDDPANFISVDANDCCMNPLYISQYFDYENYCSQYSLLITPNPAVSEATVSIIAVSENEYFDENAEWKMEVFDNMQNQKLKNEKLKGKNAKIQTAGWKEGVYIVRVKYKNKILQEKLVVTK